jgi:hypothetical protein
MFVGPIHHPATAKEAKFTKLQESLRKDIERAFGVLQVRWAILVTASRLWTVPKMRDIMLCCIVLHNMMVEEAERLGYDYAAWACKDLGRSNIADFEGGVGAIQDSTQLTYVNTGSVAMSWKDITDPLKHWALREALINHVSMY